jgi:hypothetical protein
VIRPGGRRGGAISGMPLEVQHNLGALFAALWPA